MKSISSVLAGCALFALSASALAGTKGAQPVFINVKFHEADGALGSARNSTDNLQKIGCEIIAYAGQAPYASCAAIDSTGRWAGCTSTDPGIVLAAAAMAGDSSILFTWDNSGNCTLLETLNDSSPEPKKP